MKDVKKRRSVSGHHNSLKNVHAVVLGKDGVGKSALTVRFLTRRFIWDYDSTLETTYRHHMEIDGQYVSLDLWDTAGKNSREKIDECAAFADLFFIVYSTTDKTSFKEATLLAKYIQQYCSLTQSAYTMVMVATKKDLKHQRQVDEYEGLFLAQDLECSFYQISNLEGYVETYELLIESVKACLHREHERKSTFSRMKEGIRETAKSLRKKSLVDDSNEIRTRPSSSSSFSSDPGTPRTGRKNSISEQGISIPTPFQSKTSLHRPISEEVHTERRPKSKEVRNLQRHEVVVQTPRKFFVEKAELPRKLSPQSTDCYVVREVFEALPIVQSTEV